MSELDNAAAGKATKAAFDHWESLEDEAHALGFSTTWEEVGGVVRECWVNSTRAAITAYLAAAARPTPDAEAMERDVIEPSDECPLSERVDGKLHTWRFDGDDPYVFCHWCGEYRDSLTNRVIRPGRKAVSRGNPQ